MTNQCQHGQLARVCLLCEQAEKIRVLREALQEAADGIDGLKGGSVSDTIRLMRAALEATK